MISAKVIADSWNGKIRLTTIEAKFHRFILPEILTHRAFSRNTSSSRAIPVAKQIERVRNDPAMPIFWGKNQAGMSAYDELADMPMYERGEWRTPRVDAVTRWEETIKEVTGTAEYLLDCGLHKQLASRVLEPFMWTTMIISATDWDNFFKLRMPPGRVMDPQFPAQPEIQQLAIEMKAAMDTGEPVHLSVGDWHLPYVDECDTDWAYDSGGSIQEEIRLSAGRCARVSYLTHDGVRDRQKDLELASRLASDGHFSPLEHQARSMGDDKYYANFRGFSQYRGFVERGLNVIQT